MPSTKPARRLLDIIDNITWIEDDIAGLNEADFIANRTIQDAVLFRLLRISEAAVKLGIHAGKIAPDQPWQQIRTFGNVLRHEYDSVSLHQVWIIITRDLPSLKAACGRGLKKI